MKRFLVLVASFLIFSAVPAMAQIQFAVAGGNLIVRGEGHTETVNSVTLTYNLTPSNTIALGTSINFAYSATVTNAPFFLGSATNGPSNVVCSINGATTCANIVETVSGNTISLTFNTAQTLATGNFITLFGVRVDVGGLGTVTTVNCSLSSSPASANITYNPTAVPVAIVVFPSITVKYSAAGTGILTCTPSTSPGTTATFPTPGPATGGTSTFTVRVRETTQHAFSTVTEELLNTPASVSATTGFTPTVTHGTQILIVITGVNAGLNVKFNGIAQPATLSLDQGFNTLGTTAVAAVAGLNGSSTVGTFTDLSSPGDDQTSTGPSATESFGFEITGGDTGGLDEVFFVFTVYKASGNTVTPGSSTVSASTELGPIGAVASVPSTTASLLFGAFPTTGNVDTISDCVTNLLFPWVVFIPTANFDTGIAIANTTKDSFASTITATPSSGAQTCTLTGFPTTTSTLSSGPTPLTQITFTTPSVPAGATYAQAVSTISPFNATSFTGYVIAVCLFQNAHGFAFISQNLGASAGVVEGYLALIVPSSISRTPAGIIGSAGSGEALNN